MLFWSDVPGTIRAARRRIPKALLVPAERRPPALLSLIALGIVALTRFVGRLEWPPRLAGRGAVLRMTMAAAMNGVRTGFSLKSPL